VVCIGKNQEGKLEAPGGGFEINQDGPGSFVSCSTWAPRTTELAWDPKQGCTHTSLNRPAGKYLVFLTSKEGSGIHDWKWVELKDDQSKVEADLTMDPARLGDLEVKVDPNFKTKSVHCTPLDVDGRLPLPDVETILSQWTSGKIDNGKAVIQGLREGKYQINAGKVTKEVEVIAGKRVEVEIKGP
jgi:hypothetical protein